MFIQLQKLCDVNCVIFSYLPRSPGLFSWQELAAQIFVNVQIVQANNECVTPIENVAPNRQQSKNVSEITTDG